MSNLTLDAITQPALLIFVADHCPTCLELTKELTGVTFNIVKINGQNGAILGPHFSIFASPTTILVNNDVEVARFYGAKNQAYIENFIADNLG